MIDIAVEQIANALNEHLTKIFYLDDDIVVVSNIGEQHGAVISGNQNKLVLSVVNIAEDTQPTRSSLARQAGVRQSSTQSDYTPPLCLNLSLLISANFNTKSYQESLKFISYTIGFFQKNPVYTPSNAPALHGEIDQLDLIMENLDIADWESLWSMMGCRCLPSVMYRVRMLAYDETHTEEYLSL